MGIPEKGANMKISHYFGVYLRPVQRIQKLLDESSGDNEVATARKPLSESSDKKRTPNFVRWNPGQDW